MSAAAPVTALTVAPSPAYATPAVASYATTINGDSADVYYPTTGTRLPVALFLQGAGVDKSHYSTYAATLASYGFVVAVPNHSRRLFGQSGLFPEGSPRPATAPRRSTSTPPATRPTRT